MTNLKVVFQCLKERRHGNQFFGFYPHKLVQVTFGGMQRTVRVVVWCHWMQVASGAARWDTIGL